MKKLNLLLLTLLFVFFANSTFGAWHYVKPSGNNANDGHTPSTAWQTITYALAHVGANEAIWVYNGTYNENLVWPDLDGIYLVGENKYQTIIKGADGLPTIKMDATGFSSTITANTRIRRLTITKQTPYDDGSGLYLKFVNPSITDVIIKKNRNSQGGGIYSSNSNFILTKSLITDNRGEKGGGINVTGGIAEIDECEISYNDVDLGDCFAFGGGLFVTGGTMNISRTNISYNTADYSSGAGRGGGISILTGSEVNLTNVLLYKNSADLGGAIYTDARDNRSFINMMYVTSTSNSNVLGYGVIYPQYTDLRIQNSILWNSSNSEISLKISSHLYTYYVDMQDYLSFDATCSASYTSNITVDPEFNNPSSDQYWLKTTSDCIGAASTYAYFMTLPSNDYLNNARPMPSNCNPDMGAYEDQILQCYERKMANVDDQSENTNFNVYPNPTSGKFSIDFSFETTSSTSLIVFNMLGETIFEKSGELPKEIDLTGKPQGIYMIKVVDGENVYFRKLIKN